MDVGMSVKENPQIQLINGHKKSNTLNFHHTFSYYHLSGSLLLPCIFKFVLRVLRPCPVMDYHHKSHRSKSILIQQENIKRLCKKGLIKRVYITN